MLNFRKITLTDEEAYREFEAAMLEDKKVNPHVEWWYVEDFLKFVSNSEESEIKQEGQSWSTFTKYYAFLDEKIVGFVICFWEMEHPDCQILGHVGYMVAPAFRRQGLATAFVNFAQDRYREKGIPSLLLTNDQDNLASRGLIEKMGGQLMALEEIDYQGQKRQSARYRLDTGQNL
jgi:predicted acetyltransferase